MAKFLTLQSAIALFINEKTEPAISKYEISRQIFYCYKTKKFKNLPLNLKKECPSVQDINQVLSLLLENGVLYCEKHDEINTKKNHFFITGRGNSQKSEFCCSLDPFCYVSHASAMEHYGITDRIFRDITITTHDFNNWKMRSRQKMKSDLGVYYDEYMQNSLPVLCFPKLKKVKKANVVIFRTKSHGNFRILKDINVRISTIGRTFFDMLREPHLCGGIDHVIEMYSEHAERYLDLIIDEFDRHGGPADKVRCGFILDKIINVTSERISAWKIFKQRGGSRKLDPSHEYSPKYSADWDISINVEGIDYE
jgi:hypothetical protein